MTPHQRVALQFLKSGIGVMEEALTAVRAALPPVEDYDVIRADYYNRLFDAMISYVSSSGGNTKWANQVRKAITEDFPAAFYAGFSDEGGTETDPEDETWLTDRIERELGFVPGLFADLKAWRESENFTEGDIEARAEMWARSLDGVYSRGKLLASKNKKLEFDGDDGEESCATCMGLKGKQKTIKWILDNDMIPEPGNENYDCKGFNCHHFWKDPKTGERYTF